MDGPVEPDHDEFHPEDDPGSRLGRVRDDAGKLIPMRIACPHCGTRGLDEFLYLGDATVARPEAEAGEAAFVDYVYLRDNPAGVHRELWQHASGCQSWLVVTRDTRTHEISAVEPARDVALARSKGAA